MTGQVIGHISERLTECCLLGLLLKSTQDVTNMYVAAITDAEKRPVYACKKTPTILDFYV